MTQQKKSHCLFEAFRRSAPAIWDMNRDLLINALAARPTTDAKHSFPQPEHTLSKANASASGTGALCSYFDDIAHLSSAL